MTSSPVCRQYKQEVTTVCLSLSWVPHRISRTFKAVEEKNEHEQKFSKIVRRSPRPGPAAKAVDVAKARAIERERERRMA